MTKKRVAAASSLCSGLFPGDNKSPRHKGGALATSWQFNGKVQPQSAVGPHFPFGFDNLHTNLRAPGGNELGHHAECITSSG